MVEPFAGSSGMAIPNEPISLRYHPCDGLVEGADKGFYLIIRVVSHLFTGSLVGIGKLPAFAGWYLVWYVRYFLYCKIQREFHFVKLCGNSRQKGGLVHQKGGRSEGKRGSRQIYDTKRPYQVFLWYR
jgi:hypothetical protein